MDTPGFFTRLSLAFGLFFKLIVDAATAKRVMGALQVTNETPAKPKTQEAPQEAPQADRDAELNAARATGALQLLGAMHREGRFVDFVMEDITGLDDADIGAAVRMVHAGCRKVVGAWFAPGPILHGEEGGPVDVQKGFDPSRVHLVGHVDGVPPFRGTLAHHGWLAERAQLPELTDAADATVVAPAEVEL